jgi:hypothetical protein
MTYEIQSDNPERTAEQNPSESSWQDKYCRLLIQSTIDDAVRNSGGQPTIISPLLAPKGQIGPDGKVLVLTDAGAVTPHQAVMGMKSSEAYGYLWTGQQSTGGPQPDAPTSAEDYRANRGKYLPGGRFSKGRA